MIFIMENKGEQRIAVDGKGDVILSELSHALCSVIDRMSGGHKEVGNVIFNTIINAAVNVCGYKVDVHDKDKEE